MFFSNVFHNIVLSGYSVPTMNCPNPILFMTSLFNRTVKTILPQVGKVYKFDNARVSQSYLYQMATAYD